MQIPDNDNGFSQPIDPTLPAFFSAIGSAVVAAIVVCAVATLFAVLQ